MAILSLNTRMCSLLRARYSLDLDFATDNWSTVITVQEEEIYVLHIVLQVSYFLINIAGWSEIPIRIIPCIRAETRHELKQCKIRLATSWIAVAIDKSLSSRK